MIIKSTVCLEWFDKTVCFDSVGFIFIFVPQQLSFVCRHCFVNRIFFFKKGFIELIFFQTSGDKKEAPKFDLERVSGNTFKAAQIFTIWETFHRSFSSSNSYAMFIFYSLVKDLKNFERKIYRSKNLIVKLFKYGAENVLFSKSSLLSSRASNIWRK